MKPSEIRHQSARMFALAEILLDSIQPDMAAWAKEAAECLRDLAEATPPAPDERPLNKARLQLQETLAALEPFANEANEYDADEDEENEAPLIKDSFRPVIELGDGTLSQSLLSVGDFRTARAVYRAHGGDA